MRGVHCFLISFVLNLLLFLSIKYAFAPAEYLNYLINPMNIRNQTCFVGSQLFSVVHRSRYQCLNSQWVGETSIVSSTYSRLIKSFRTYSKAGKECF